jgi:uncharacterized membrane protein YhaH (DUF805 family)
MPSLAVSARRLHDVNFNEWWLLPSLSLAFVFYVLVADTMLNGVILENLVEDFSLEQEMRLMKVFFVSTGIVFYSLFPLYLFTKRGTIGENRYGADPLANSASSTLTPNN